MAELAHRGSLIRAGDFARRLLQNRKCKSRSDITNNKTIKADETRAARSGFAAVADVETAPHRLRPDCVHYAGDRPCRAGVQGVCPDPCDVHRPQGTRVLIIKLGALGDVIRTAAILPAIRRAWPMSHVTWISRPSGVRALANHPGIDRLLAFDGESICHLLAERFDVCLSLDKEPAPAGLAMRVNARDRRGIGLSEWGTPVPLNPECAAYFALGLDDHLKFSVNRKSYPQLIVESVGLEYHGDRYELFPSTGQRAAAALHWQRINLNERDRVVGLNTGAGRVFANKAFPADKWIELARRLVAESPFRVALFGGPDERDMNRAIAAAVPGVMDAGSDHDELTFAALLERCAVVVAGDTMAMHVAVAMRRPVVALFGPTCVQEIDLFGMGEKLSAGLACAPCYKRKCDISPNCMDEIPLDAVFAAIMRQTESQRAPAPVTVALPMLSPAQFPSPIAAV
ncbi:MAG: glycosyltransferase family 9 protein [Phycisphaerales bacterium]|nr:glycosyltransferase family 9 protein [Phycisphaerales bacterium]